MSEFNLEDVFGKMGQRPTTPEFWRLSEIMLRMDGAIEAARTTDEKEQVWHKEVAKHIGDRAALTYMGMQRMLFALGIQTHEQLVKQMLKDPVTPTKMMTLWAEGFMVGDEYGHHTKQELKLRLMEMLDGYDALVEDDNFQVLETAAAEAKKLIDREDG